MKKAAHVISVLCILLIYAKFAMFVFAIRSCEPPYCWDPMSYVQLIDLFFPFMAILALWKYTHPDGPKDNVGCMPVTSVVGMVEP